MAGHVTTQGSTRGHLGEFATSPSRSRSVAGRRASLGTLWPERTDCHYVIGDSALTLQVGPHRTHAPLGRGAECSGDTERRQHGAQAAKSRAGGRLRVPAADAGRAWGGPAWTAQAGCGVSWWTLAPALKTLARALVSRARSLDDAPAWVVVLLDGAPACHTALDGAPAPAWAPHGTRQCSSDCRVRVEWR